MTDKARPCPEDTLKPCPFCGTTKSYVRLPTCKRDDDYDADDRAFPVVRCGECFAEAVGKDWDHKGRSAIAAWNCRSNPSLTAEIERLREALRPFVREFKDRRDSYIRRYPRNPGVGAHNFDTMPDEWEMENSTFTMGDFRRARSALGEA